MFHWPTRLICAPLSHELSASDTALCLYLRISSSSLPSGLCRCHSFHWDHLGTYYSSCCPTVLDLTAFRPLKGCRFLLEAFLALQAWMSLGSHCALGSSSVCPGPLMRSRDSAVVCCIELLNSTTPCTSPKNKFPLLHPSPLCLPWP